VQTVTGGISDNFSRAEQRESTYGQTVSADCRQIWKLFIPKSQYTVGGPRSVQSIKVKKAAQ
jgi:hypothetical protein